MTRRMLIGIKRRAEALYRDSAAASGMMVLQ
jgi:hypothetical protein